MSDDLLQRVVGAIAEAGLAPVYQSDLALDARDARNLLNAMKARGLVVAPENAEPWSGVAAEEKGMPLGWWP